MKNYILIIFLVLIAGQGFATGNERSFYPRHRAYYPKSLEDPAWNDMHYLGDFPNPTITFQIGGMWLNNNAKLRVNSESLGVGTTLDLDRDLGVKPSAFAGTSTIYIRIGKRHQIVADAFGYQRSKTKTLSRDIQFDDTTFYANAAVKVKTHFVAYNLDYRFSIYRTSRAEVGLSVGAKLYDVFASINAELNQNQVSYSQRKRIFAPALLPGIHGSFYVTDFILLRAKAEYLQLTVNDFNFQVLEIRPAIEVYPIPNLGIGASYNYYNVGVKKTPDEDFDGEIKYIINGASLFASLRF